MESFLIIVIISLFILFTYWIFHIKSEDETRTKEGLTKLLPPFVQIHIKALAVKRLQKRRKDDYGNIVDKGWNEEMDYFFENVFLVRHSYFSPRFHPDANPYTQRALVYSIINSEINNYEMLDLTSQVNVDEMDPIGYEAYCAKLLNDHGWIANTTKASGDQGIDIIASRNGKKAVFQCKQYSKPVGNKAVQEVLSGKSFSSADFAFVVTNSDFTEAARELASKTGVYLIHHTQLTDLSSLLPKN